MRIESIETFLNGQVALVRIRTDDGAEGWGQVSTFCADITVQVLHTMVAGLVLGEPVEGFEELMNTVIMKLNKFTGTFVCRAVSGIDTALWDLRAKANGVNIAASLGAKSRKVRIYASEMQRSTQLDEQIERLRPYRDELGATAFKIKLGPMGAFGSDADTWPGRTEAMIPYVREHLGADVDIIADANSCFTPETAIKVGHMLQEHNYTFFEEPCSWWDIEGTARVNAALEMPVCGGEQDFQIPQWERMIAMDAVDTVQPDPCYVGGFSRTLEVARLAAAAGKRCMPHTANWSLVTLFGLSALAVIPNPGPYGELNIDRDDWTKDIFEPVYEVVDGCVEIPDGPGWGVTINPEWLAKAERRESRS